MKPRQRVLFLSIIFLIVSSSLMILTLLITNPHKINKPQLISEKPTPFQKNSLENCIICIDASHGGSDSGAIASNGLKEKTIQSYCTRYPTPILPQNKSISKHHQMG